MAGTIKLTVEGDTVGMIADGNGVEIIKSVSDADAERLIMAYGVLYMDKWKDENGAPFVPTTEQILVEWFNGIVEGSRNAVLKFEKTEASKQAAEAITKIEIT